MTLALADFRTAVFALLDDTGKALYADAQVDASLRWALAELNLATTQTYTISSLDGAGATTVPANYSGPVSVGAAGWCALSRALSHVNTNNLQADMTEELRAIGQYYIDDFYKTISPELASDALALQAARAEDDIALQAARHDDELETQEADLQAKIDLQTAEDVANLARQNAKAADAIALQAARDADNVAMQVARAAAATALQTQRDNAALARIATQSGASKAKILLDEFKAGLSNDGQPSSPAMTELDFPEPDFRK
jgi:hypothetical protein